MLVENLRREYPFASHFQKLDGLRYHYIDEGQGDPVVMVHGNPSWSFYYRNLVNELKSTHRCIVPDHIGCGFSDKPSETTYSYQLKDRIQNFTEFIDNLNLQSKISLVAHDWGGMIATAWAVHHIDRLKSITLLNTAAFHLPKNKSFPMALRLARDSSFGAYLVRKFNAFSYGASVIGCKQKPMSKDLRKLYQMPYDSEENRIATLKFVQDIPLRPEDPSYPIVSEVEKKLSRLKDVPVLFAWGMKDFVFDASFLEEWKKRLPHGKALSYPNAGHYVLEDVGDELIGKVSSFIREQ